ncbi:LysE family transporter [Litchfieldia salsa]|uniref:Threonine/homoserine/homoserine lactone efflux protein n=1 Tax=Litchfieldia salsa TaxID=930152 RepID=A0A1H0VKC8_9BACI|nr:LysE family transporter [Litchfieldia salsa]SDP78526.1 Threonine/homoserine/homoserine lactone efflux protein [Litchfieldia salsa]
MSVFFSYILLGLSLAAPIGPVNAAQIDRGIKNGFLHAWLVGVGAVVADGIYMLIVYFGVVQFIDTPIIKTFLWLFGAFVLIYTGIESLFSAGKIQTKSYRDQSEPLYKAFLSGFLMSLTNPLTILFWLGIFGSVLAKTASTYAQAELILYSAAIFIGLLIWDVAMAAISSSFRKLLTTQLLILISFLSGLSLIGFGIYFGIQGVKLLIGI